MLRVAEGEQGEDAALAAVVGPRDEKEVFEIHFEHQGPEHEGESPEDTGFGYLRLGQPATTLSGGEAQRVKIASELYRPMMTKTMYLLDEPTVGLHYDDVQKLIDILQKLIERGNSVVVIEHNLDVLKCADYIVDMGPEGGQGGGQIVAKGTPEEVSKTDGSHTGYYLKRVLKKKKA